METGDSSSWANIDNLTSVTTDTPFSRMGFYNSSINNSHNFMSTLHHEDMLLTIYDEVFDEFPHLDEDKKLEMVCQRFEDLCQ
jgi:hypothetical protein